jgi:hypothetical protein
MGNYEDLETPKIPTIYVKRKKYDFINKGYLRGTPAVKVDITTINDSPKFSLRNNEQIEEFADLVGTAPTDQYPTPALFIDVSRDMFIPNISSLFYFIECLIFKNNFTVYLNMNGVFNILEIYKKNLIQELIQIYLNKNHQNENFLKNLHFIISPMTFVEMESFGLMIPYDSVVRYYMPLDKSWDIPFFREYLLSNIHFELIYSGNSQDTKFIKDFIKSYNEKGIELQRNNMCSISLEYNEKIYLFSYQLDEVKSLCLDNSVRLIG